MESGQPSALALEALLEMQRGIAVRGQLNARGVDDMSISRRVGRGDWQRLVPGVYLLSAAAPSTEQRRIAAALYAGENAQLTGLAALHWYGFRHAPNTDKVHALVPHQTRRRSAGFVLIQRTHALDQKPRYEQVYWLTSPARAVVDACRQLADLRDVRAIVAEAVQAGHTGLDDLHDELRRAARSRTALVRRALKEVVDGVRSSPEAELRAVLLSSRKLPLVLWNPSLVALDGTQLPTPDGFVPDAALAIEVDSRAHHSQGDGWQQTLRRANVLEQYGLAVLHFTPNEIRYEPARVRRTVERTCEIRLAAGVVSRGTLLYKIR